MILTTFYYHLLLWNFALNGPPEAADDPYLHLGVALEATLGIRNFWVFLIQLTFPSMEKVVSFLSEFLRILGTTVGCTVHCDCSEEQYAIIMRYEVVFGPVKEDEKSDEMIQ